MAFTSLNPFLFKAQSLPAELQYRFFLELTPKTILNLCTNVNPVGPCNNPDFWREKYQKDFIEFRINLNVQSYRDRYLEIANLMRPGDWFGAYTEDENILRSIVVKSPRLPLESPRLPRDFALALKSLPPGRMLIVPPRIVPLPQVNITTFSFKNLYYPQQYGSYGIELTKFLMLNKSVEFAKGVVSELRLNRLLTDTVGIYDFLFYLKGRSMAGTMASDGSMVGGVIIDSMVSRVIIGDFVSDGSGELNRLLTNDEISVASSLNLNMLRSFYGHPTINDDHVSLLFYVLTGLVVPRVNPDPERLAYIAQFSPMKVWYLYSYYARKRAIDEDPNQALFEDSNWYGFTDGLSPHQFVASQIPDTMVENTIMNVNENNYMNVIQEMMGQHVYTSSLNGGIAWIIGQYLDDYINYKANLGQQ